MICINIKVYLVICKRYRSPIMKYTSSPTNLNFPKKSIHKITVINSSENIKSNRKEEPARRGLLANGINENKPNKFNKSQTNTRE